jgi:hypothetical protein
MDLCSKKNKQAKLSGTSPNLEFHTRLRQLQRLVSTSLHINRLSLELQKLHQHCLNQTLCSKDQQVANLMLLEEALLLVLLHPKL